MKIKFKNYWRKEHNVNILFELRHVYLDGNRGSKHLIFISLLNFGIVLSTKSKKS